MGPPNLHQKITELPGQIVGPDVGQLRGRKNLSVPVAWKVGEDSWVLLKATNVKGWRKIRSLFGHVTLKWILLSIKWCLIYHYFRMGR